MKRTLLPLILGALFLLGYSFVFAEQSTYKKDKALNLAFKEEAMREAFQEEEMKALLDDVGKAGGSSSPGFSFEPLSYLKTDIIYSDNVWNVADNVKSDLWLYLNPGVKLTLGNLVELYANRFRQKLELDLGAEITHSFYRAVSLNRESPYGRLTYGLDGGKNKLMFSNYFIKGYNLASGLVNDTEGLIGFQGNTTELNWEYNFNRLGLGLGYGRKAYEYFKEYKISNTYEDSVGIITGFLNITPKTRVFLEYNYGRYEYTKVSTDINNYDYSIFWVGANGKLTKKLFGLAKFGYQNYEYAGGISKDGMMTVKADLEYRQSPKSTFLLNLSIGDTSTGYTDLGIDRQYSAKLGFLRDLNRKLILKGNLSFINDNYKDGQVDNTYGYSLSLNYLFQKWMKIKLGYEYQDKSSTNRTAKYKYNKYFFGTELAF